MAVLLVCGVYCCLQISHIIHTVEDTDDIDAVGDGFLNEILNHVIGIGTVSQNVLTAEQHLQFGILESVTEFSQSLPGIFLQETQGSIEGGSSPALYGMVSHFIHLVHDGQHLLGCHSCGNQGLMRVTQNCLSNLNRFLHNL